MLDISMYKPRKRMMEMTMGAASHHHTPAMRA
jgi:hypothetical protein